MSFRGRLISFFAAIVVIPMATVMFLLFQVAESARVGQADAVLRQALRASLTEYETATTELATKSDAAATDVDLANAIRDGDQVLVEAALRSLAERNEFVWAAALDSHGKLIVEVGEDDPVGAVEVGIAETGGGLLGSIQTASMTAEDLSAELRKITKLDLVLSQGQRTLAKSRDVGTPDFTGADGAIDTKYGTRAFRAVEARLASPVADVRLALFSPVDGDSLVISSPTILAGVAVFFVLAVILVLTVIRSLQGQVSEMLSAAKRVGSGDFSRQVPVHGKDELASLAHEFNHMSGRLEEQIGAISRQRSELNRSVERIGEALAQGLNRQAVLGIMVETAMAACEATHGQFVHHGDETLRAEGRASEPTPDLLHVMAEVERAALQHACTIEGSGGDNHALSHLLLSEDGRRVLGVMTLGRPGRPFVGSDRARVEYLLSKAAVSIANIGHVQRVSVQAKTDELTGLANNRHFREWMGGEVRRAGRFGHELSLMLIDVDNFKQVNDSRGHLQGDDVLRVLGRILASHARQVDMPARYGGEEFAVALPETGVDGAREFAERIREAIEMALVPSISGGEPIAVTASIGVATLPSDAEDVNGLIAAADGALYSAKRAGKNRVAVARSEVPVA